MKQNQKTDGFTLVDLMMVIAVLVFLGWMCMPSLTSHPASATRIHCTNNLKQVGLAFRIWAGDNNDKMPMQVSVTNGGAMESVMAGNVAAVFQAMSNELNTPKILFCPTDKKRTQATIFVPANPSNTTPGRIPFVGHTNLSYFAGLDTLAADTNLLGMFLSGDDNILTNGVTVKLGILSLTTNTPVTWSEFRHKKQGNVGLADGSVQGFSSAALRSALVNTGVGTNRLAMP